MICDLAEYYHILNYRELSSDLVATLILGLSENSRTKRFFSNTIATIEQIMLAHIADNLRFISWTKTKNAKGKYNEKSFVKILNGEYKKESDDELVSFATVEEYEAYMSSI